MVVGNEGAEKDPIGASDNQVLACITNPFVSWKNLTSCLVPSLWIRPYSSSRFGQRPQNPDSHVNSRWQHGDQNLRTRIHIVDPPPPRNGSGWAERTTFPSFGEQISDGTCQGMDPIRLGASPLGAELCRTSGPQDREWFWADGGLDRERINTTRMSTTSDAWIWADGVCP